MFDDPLFWAISSIFSAILGAAVLAYVKDSRIGLWGYSKFDKAVDTVRDKYDIDWLDQPQDAWRGQEPELAAKIDELEARISKLEKR